MAIAGFVIAIRSFNLPFDDPSIAFAHGTMGVAAMSLLFAQVLFAPIGPILGKDSKSNTRWAWEILHKIVGRAAQGVAAINLFTARMLRPGQGSEDDLKDFTASFPRPPSRSGSPHKLLIIFRVIWICRAFISSA